MDTGMVVLVIMVILPVGGGAVFLLPSRHSRDGNTRHETFNANAESPSALTTDGSGSANRRCGAGVYTAPHRRPLIADGEAQARARPANA